MIKTIDFDGFNEAEIVKIYDGGAILCNLLQTDEQDIVIREEKNISFDGGYWPFELSKEEVAEFCPFEEIEELNQTQKVQEEDLNPVIKID